ncbi:MAG: hypothetical protein MI892_23325, partial [Desulfobacterales bacterium]|nr:hypothetical protein [Desulfobacterales bacterium]
MSENHKIHILEKELQLAQERIKFLEEQESDYALSQKVANIGHYRLNLKTGGWICSAQLDKILGIQPDFIKNIESWYGLIQPSHLDEMQTYFEQEVIAKKHPFNRKYQVINQTTGKV